MNELDQIVAYENGELESKKIIDLFQSLIDSDIKFNSVNCLTM